MSGLGGTAKPGYTPYTYPHPLRSSPPAATQSATPSSVQDHSKEEEKQKTKRKKPKRVKQNSVNEMTEPQDTTIVVTTALCAVPNGAPQGRGYSIYGRLLARTRIRHNNDHNIK